MTVNAKKHNARCMITKITKDRFVEICREAGLYVKDSVQDDETWAYLNSRDTDGWTAYYDGCFTGHVFVNGSIDYYVDDDGPHIIYEVGSHIMDDEEKFKKYLYKLIKQSKNIKKKLRKNMIKEL